MTQIKPKEQEPVTIIISRVVKPGHEDEFEAWLKGIGKDVQQFEGYMGVNILKKSTGSGTEYVNVFRFDSYDNMHKWERSDIRKRWLDKLDHMVICVTEPKIVTGLEYWFTLPDKPLEQPPPRYKMAILIWAVIFPILLVLPPIIRDIMAGQPAYLITAVTSMIMVTLMTYLIMPQITRIFSGWLFGDKS